MTKTSKNGSWSRHYDTLLWTQTSIFGAAIGGLFVYVHSQSHFDIILAIFGLLITPFPVYFAAGFRQLRFKCPDRQSQGQGLHSHLPQWGPYVIMFGLLEVLWGYLLFSKTGNWVWWCVIVPLIGYFVWIRHKGLPPKEEPSDDSKENTNE